MASYSACKTKVMIIDGTAAAFDKEKKFIPSTTSDGTTTAWPLDTEVTSFNFLGTVLDKHSSSGTSTLLTVSLRWRMLCTMSASSPRTKNSKSNTPHASGSEAVHSLCFTAPKH
jgi:hypothetical protein